MKKFLTVCLSIFILPNCPYTQCECPDLPSLNNKVVSVEVSSVDGLQQALLAAQTNNGNYEIILNSGIYQLSRNLLYIGQNMKHLTIRSKSGDAKDVVIRGNGMTGNVTHIFNVAAKRFTAADLTIGWVANHAIQIHGESDADSALIQNVRFFDIGEQMLKGSGGDTGTYSDDCIVQCCHFEFTNGVASQYYTGGIDTHKGKNWRVFNNTFIGIRSPEQQLAEHAIHFWNECYGTVVENNTIINCDRGIGFGLGAKGHEGGLIQNNMVHTSRDVGIGLESSPNTKVYNNTVVTDNYFNSIEYRFDITQNVHIANNLIDKSIASRNDGSGNVERNYTFRNTDIFVDYQNHDYHISMEVSGIFNAAIDVMNDIDFDCARRSHHGAPDIGADEWKDFFTSSNELDTKVLLISPNPALDRIKVNFHGELSKLILTSSHGQALDLKYDDGEIEIGHLTNGIYIISILSSSGYWRHGRFVKK